MGNKVTQISLSTQTGFIRSVSADEGWMALLSVDELLQCATLKQEIRSMNLS